MAYVANGVGDALVFNTSIALAGAILGFFIWNWPSGKIFFGDGGAYLVGFILAELSVLLVVRNPSISPWFPLLLLIYPIFETIYTIYRRKVENQISPGLPDNQHLHQLIHDRLIPAEQANGTLDRNSRVAPYLWVPTTVTALLAVAMAHSTTGLVICSVAFCLGYVFSYRRIIASGEQPTTLDVINNNTQ
jgi:UDP-N-acetylmuramyl pentapeptide phosphotransferase/UDP-N-acetylglucosamine-1-phosphate transferase